jgi:tetratricopeptide (TPR) repeat protein
MVEIASKARRDKSSLDYAHLLNTQGVVHYELNRLGPAREAIEIARDIRVEKLAQNDPEVAMTLANLGNIEAAEGNLDEALELFEQAAAIREKVGDTAASMLAMNFLMIGRVWFLKGDYLQAYELYQRSEAMFMKKVGQTRSLTASLHFAYGNLEFAQENFSAAARSYELCRRISMDYNPLHPLTAAACYKLACAAFEQNHHKKALNLLEKALDIADIKSNGTVDGTCARILWKRAEILLDDPLGNRREEGHRLMTDVELRLTEIAEQLGIDLQLDKLQEGEDKEKTFDMLVPGHLR